MLNQIKQIYLDYAPWVLGVLAPSIITALLASPKTSKLGDKLKWVLGLFSIVTHYDSPTSFKLPLVPVPTKAPEPPPEIRHNTTSSALRPCTKFNMRWAACMPASSGTGWAACTISMCSQSTAWP